MSEQTASEMAAGVITHSHAQVAVSVTGIAGPDGGTPEKPVGMVCFAWIMKDGLACAETRYFTGSREEIRRQSVGGSTSRPHRIIYTASRRKSDDNRLFSMNPRRGCVRCRST